MAGQPTPPGHVPTFRNRCLINRWFSPTNFFRIHLRHPPTWERHRRGSDLKEFRWKPAASLSMTFCHGPRWKTGTKRIGVRFIDFFEKFSNMIAWIRCQDIWSAAYPLRCGWGSQGSSMQLRCRIQQTVFGVPTYRPGTSGNPIASMGLVYLPTFYKKTTTCR